MNAENIKIAIRKALAATAGDSAFHETSAALLRAMKYRSERTLAGQTGDPGDFVQAFPAANPATKSEQEFLDSAKSVRVLFQYTDEEVRSDAQPALFEDRTFYRNNDRAFIFSAVDLECDSYPRGRYAAFTREINKRIDAPTIVLFRTPANLVTLAFVHRRPNKRDASRDVLGSVSLIREIDAADPHRAHLDILAELSLSERLGWMDERAKTHNFDGLLDAWLYALDTEELNKSFYRDLFQWFERAVSVAKFPSDRRKKLEPERHVIRLITRLLFVWFIKEKRLIADDLFIENRVKGLLKDYDRATGDSYYRAVLQNLFFATLNTEIGQRGFSSVNNNTYRNFSKYRFRNQIADEAALMDLFKQTPFINGGLFDCLDSEASITRGGYRIDCFSDVDYRKLSIPNRLFFGDDGLITLFEKYKFTVEENTPVEREVALDPELLGKVFENLLAAYNPETRDNARKQTGSYYTPRAVVDYMVDEALVASLAQNAKTEDSDSWERRLRYLMDYDDAFDDADELFTQQEREAIVRAISETKILDPAVGSGAFPMGTLHKLTLALRRLDSDNKIWERLQRQLASNRASDAFGTNDQTERDEELKEISETFEKYRDSDYGRKLYLIQNSIYGVDIQPVATQIAKLRFFISLAIEQQTDPAADNYGIKPLPNLETRFVAANTLLGLDRPEQMMLVQTDAVQDIQRDLDRNRERYFHANSRRVKLDCQDEDERLRQKMANTLRRLDLSEGDAAKLAKWNPFDQNTNADWFDAEYMFGLADGFDVVIGNPPYVRSEAGGEIPALREKIIQSGNYDTIFEKWDLFIPFVEQGYKLLKPRGFTTMIVSDAYCHARYAKKSREYFLGNARVVRLDFFSKIKIFEAGVHNITYLFQKADGENNEPERRVHAPEFGTVNLLPTKAQRDMNERVFFPEDTVVQEATIPTRKLSDICYVSYGLRPSSKANAKEKFVTSDLTSTRYDKLHSRKYVDGKHLVSWLPRHHLWIEWGTDRSPSDFYAPTFPKLHSVNEKLLAKKNCGSTPIACYDNEQIVFSASVIGFLNWDSLAGIRNRSISKQARYRDQKQLPHLPSRENLEEISKKFSIHFLLGVLNSSYVTHYLIANRRHNVSLYPNDWKNIPIPDVTSTQQEPVINLVDRILKAKSADPEADVTVLEWDINDLVYELYGLTEDEIDEIEGSLDPVPLTAAQQDAALLKAMQDGKEEARAEGYATREEVMAILQGSDGD